MKNIWEAFFGTPKMAKATIMTIIILITIIFLVSNADSIAETMIHLINVTLKPLLIIALMIYGLKYLVRGPKKSGSK